MSKQIQCTLSFSQYSENVNVSDLILQKIKIDNGAIDFSGIVPEPDASYGIPSDWYRSYWDYWVRGDRFTIHDKSAYNLIISFISEKRVPLEIACKLMDNHPDFTISLEWTSADDKYVYKIVREKGCRAELRQGTDLCGIGVKGKIWEAYSIDGIRDVIPFNYNSQGKDVKIYLGKTFDYNDSLGSADFELAEWPKFVPVPIDETIY